jgi:hypothetical protein
MRDGQKKKEHECCAAHFSFVSTNILSTRPRTKNVSVGHALLIWSFAAGDRADRASSASSIKPWLSTTLPFCVIGYANRCVAPGATLKLKQDRCNHRKKAKAIAKRMDTFPFAPGLANAILLTDDCRIRIASQAHRPRHHRRHLEIPQRPQTYWREL